MRGVRGKEKKFRGGRFLDENPKNCLDGTNGFVLDLLLVKRKDEESTCICCITEKFRGVFLRDFRRAPGLRGMCRDRWKMASEWCTEL